MSDLDPRFTADARAAYAGLNDSPMQRRLRTERPCWVGAVYWNPQEESYEHLLGEMKRIRETGFTFVRFHAIDPDERPDGTFDFRYPDHRFQAAHEAGLKVYPHLVSRSYSEVVLKRHGLDEAQAKRLGLVDPRVHEAAEAWIAAVVGHYRHHPALAAWPTQGEPGAMSIPLETDEDRRRFLAWLQQRYADPQAVHRAWAIYPTKQPLFVASWDDAVTVAGSIRKGDGVTLSTTGLKHEVFGAQADLVRFRCEESRENLRRLVALIRKHDPDHCVPVGNHQLFYNHPQLAWDSAEEARVGDMHFTSIHLSWHFEHVEGEIDRPVYLQSRFTKDFFKGGATSAYETTGGPVQYSGGFGHHMDAGLMRRLCLSYLAAGNEVLAFWCWKWRPGGLEAGEYALVSLSGEVTPWAHEIGAVARAMERHRDEVWQAYEEPGLALLRSWDSEMVLSLEPSRFDCQQALSNFSKGSGHQHMKALIGAARAATDAQVAFEFVTEKELLAGIAGAYPVLYCPHLRGCSDALLERLLAYVEAGGTLIGDVQFGFHDGWGKVRARGRGTLLDRLFGGWVDGIHDARTCPQRIGDVAIDGFYGDLVLTSARPLRRFADGRVAISEAVIGRGRAILAAADLGRLCWKPGSGPAQDLLADLYRDGAPPRWTSDAPMAVRRSHAAADHYFLLNDGPARSAVIRCHDHAYTAVEDVLAGTSTPVRGTIAVDLPTGSGLWLRCVRKP